MIRSNLTLYTDDRPTKGSAMKTSELKTVAIPTASRAAREPAENPLRWVIEAAVEREGESAVVYHTPDCDVSRVKKWLRNAARDIGKTARIKDDDDGATADGHTCLIVWTVPLISRKRKTGDTPAG